jgi:hypothetical protein
MKMMKVMTTHSRRNGIKNENQNETYFYYLRVKFKQK